MRHKCFNIILTTIGFDRPPRETNILLMRQKMPVHKAFSNALALKSCSYEHFKQGFMTKSYRKHVYVWFMTKLMFTYWIIFYPQSLIRLSTTFANVFPHRDAKTFNCLFSAVNAGIHLFTTPCSSTISELS